MRQGNEEEKFLLKIDKAFPENGEVINPLATDVNLLELIKAARLFALVMAKLIPHSRERSLALTHFEEAVGWCIRGLAK